MCGIATILKAHDADCPARVVDAMRETVSYRGPDDAGSAFFRQGKVLEGVSPDSSDWQVGLGHRRLAILDLSPAGHQPMGYRQKFWTVYNGEVYSFSELASELEKLGHTFRSSSDTEVILAAYAQWGPECFSRFRGMWGIVIYDTVRQEVVLCRDRLGIKPLYLWERSGIVAVASEIKQFQHVPGFAARLDATAANEYLRTGYEDSTRSFFRDVKPLPPGCWLRIPLNGLKPSPPERYWYPERVQVSITDPREAGELFGEKLRECVRLCLRSDVPVGCALSGGLDSSSISVLVSALKNGDSSPLHTFTSTFPGSPIDERSYVDAVLKEIKASPHFVTPDPSRFLEDLDRFLWVHDEPMGSFSMYAGYCVARLTREAGVPVTLNGQGGDEILSGYWQTYFLYLRQLWKQGRLLDLSSHFAGALTKEGNSALIGQVPVMLSRYRARRNPIQMRIRKLHEGQIPDILGGILALDESTRRVEEIRNMFLPRLLRWDDRNFMAFSVEGRYPFLDHPLIELCLSIAPEALYSRGWTKWPLRVGLKDLLPIAVAGRRSKFGFETPQDDWICHALRPRLEKWLAGDSPAWDYVEREDVRRLAEQTWQLAGRRGEPGQALFRTFIFDRWAQLFSVST